ncbi:unnamed protein product [Thelazia callipaeda]|uniref:Uncharacterized protein n=1 Tax=Thelazia callipaeda TaxID=103827 RepID=A0A0N5CLY2_THECL|nr:unnamed protein product [Thelazia callipaeda]
MNRCDSNVSNIKKESEKITAGIYQNLEGAKMNNNLKIGEVRWTPKQLMFTVSFVKSVAHHDDDDDDDEEEEHEENGNEWC